jgi:hypothetical protein
MCNGRQNCCTSPTIFLHGPYRFYFFSREEPRIHVRAVRRRRSEIWLDPKIELAQNHGLNKRQISATLRLIKEHEDEIRKAWEERFGG